MADSIIASPRQSLNDEPVYEDRLGHHSLAKQLGDRILHCPPPYVLGVQGAWGSGKTSFLRKVWAYLGGETGLPKETLQGWFGMGWAKPGEVHPIWFNPWQHQFESSPMVALLQEIRRHFTLTRKFFDEAGKLADVTAYSALTMLGEISDLLPTLDVKKVVERGREYEAEHFSAPLSSQRFSDLFEAAIRQVTKNGRMVVFIDDLDRCEGAVAYRLLESLKLYLNAENCVYVLGLDQKHLEETVARVLSGKEDHWRYRPLAREYLAKMFQCQFLLPVTSDVQPFIRDVLNLDEDAPFAGVLMNRFGVPFAKRGEVVQTLDGCLAHNPRKIKGFIAGWKLYLLLLAEQKPTESFDWQLTVALNYLAQFEEPLYRKVEEAPGFLKDEILKFCYGRGCSSQFQALFEGLELPYDALRPEPGAPPVATSPPESFEPPAPAPAPLQQVLSAPSPMPRVFWIRDLVTNLGQQTLLLDRSSIDRHLLRARHGIL